MIEIKDIAKTFGDREVLSGISGTFQPGETSLIIGGSGTGKSVLLKCMIGLIKPNRGEVLYDGRNFLTANLEEQKSIRREMGVLFQGSALFDSKTVLENVRFPLDMLTEQSEDEKEKQAREVLKRVELEKAADLMPSEISGGMKKRVGIARAIVLNPKYLFCDEPNSGLDPLTSITIDKLIQEITTEYQITTVVITHDMNSMMEIGEQIMFLYQGHKLWEGNSDTLVKSDVPELNEFIFASKLIRDMKK